MDTYTLLITLSVLNLIAMAISITLYLDSLAHLKQTEEILQLLKKDRN